MADSLDLFINPIVKTSLMSQVEKITAKSSTAAKKFENTGTSAYANLSKGAKTLNDKQKQLNDRFNKGTSSFSKLMGAMGAYFTFSAVKDFYTSSIAGAKAKIEVETKLAAILKNVDGLQGDNTRIAEGTKMLTEYASKLQEVGVIGDEVTIAGQAQLATFNLMPETIQMLTDGMGDLLANTAGLNATQGDAVNVANMLGKAMMGQASALTRVGVTMTDAQAELIKTGTASEKAAVLAKVLQQNVGGVNKALAQTDAGKIKNFENAWGDVKEQVGMGVLPAISKVTQALKEDLPDIQNTLGNATSGILDLVGTIYQFRVPLGIILGLYAAFNFIIGLNAFILSAQATALNISKLATEAYTGAQWLLNAALTANPIGLVIAGVAALGAAFYIAYNKILPFRTFIDDLWEKMKNSLFGKVISSIFSGSAATLTINENTAPSNAQIAGSPESAVGNFATNTNNTNNTTVQENITINGGLNPSSLSQKIKDTVAEHNRQELAAMGAD